uniref:Protein BASIC PENTACYSTEINE7 isoform X2 n=1 Tax=Rhizophora mucronata TaxID=61149 RepID=A0A2P2J7S1_RHIMU
MLHHQHICLSAPHELHKAWNSTGWEKNEQWGIYETFTEVGR